MKMVCINYCRKAVEKDAEAIFELVNKAYKAKEIDNPKYAFRKPGCDRLKYEKYHIDILKRCTIYCMQKHPTSFGSSFFVSRGYRR